MMLHRPHSKIELLFFSFLFILEKVVGSRQFTHSFPASSGYMIIEVLGILIGNLNYINFILKSPFCITHGQLPNTMLNLALLILKCILDPLIMLGAKFGIIYPD